MILGLSATLTVVVSVIAIPLGFGFMYFFGGVVSPKAIKLYLSITKGKHIVLPREPRPGLQSPEIVLKLRRQVVYFAFILVIVVSFAAYLAKHRLPIVASLGRPSDIVTLMTGDFIVLTMTASLVIPAVTLALPYFGGLRLRSIDVGPFHTTVLSTIIGVSGGFSLLYSILSKPAVEYLLFYVFLFVGVSWCFAMGCNLAAEPANRRIAHEVYGAKPSGRLLPSRIWLEFPPGKFIET